MNPLQIVKAGWGAVTTVFLWQWYLGMLSWVWFFLVQLVMLAFTILGFVLLIPFCLMEAWQVSPIPSIGPKPWLPQPRIIDRWRFAPLNWIYGNPEDGVSGQRALIWGSGGQAGWLVKYMPGTWAPWRAYCWSALRNPVDSLKYVFQWRGKNPPFSTGSFALFGLTIRYTLGWKLENEHYLVPIFSIR